MFPRFAPSQAVPTQGCICRYIKITEMSCSLRKLFFFPLVTWHCYADGITSFLMGLASPRDVFVKGKLPDTNCLGFFLEGGGEAAFETRSHPMLSSSRELNSFISSGK